MKNPQSRTPELPSWLWLWLPPLPVVLIVGTYYLAPDLHHRWFLEKEGPLEWGTALVLIPGVIAGILTLRHRARLPLRRLGLWLAVMTLGAFYYGAEEISWGQQIWCWDSPEVFEGFNRQQETNLHNMSSLFNEKPRLLLELWILIGGIVVALRQRMRWSDERWKADDWRTWFWPTWITFPTAVLAIGIYLPKRFQQLFGDFESGTLLGDLRLSEPQEFYFALFLTFYLLSFSLRLRPAPEGV